MPEQKKERVKKRKKRTFPIRVTASGIDITADRHNGAFVVTVLRGQEVLTRVALDADNLSALASGHIVFSIGGTRNGKDVTVLQVDAKNPLPVTQSDVMAALLGVFGRVMRAAAKQLSPDIASSLNAQAKVAKRALTLIGT